MAVAARPGPTDARVPCPLCGGLVHPIAGKCKHCKADLSAYHAKRPAANAPLPALLGAAPGHAQASGAPAQPVRALYAASMPAAAEAVLPPRPTGRSYAAEPVPSGWRSWPVIVIIIATLAIIVAIVLMAWPAGRSEPDGKRGAPQPPAPERMQTDPEVHPSAPPKVIQPTPPPQGGAPRDPWGKVDPPPVDPDNGAAAQADDDPDVDSLLDPFATPAPPAGGGRPRLRINGRGLAMLAMAEHMCKKLVQCGVGDPAARSMCNGFSRRGAVPPPSCPAARRCLDRIDTMACGGPDDDLANLNGFMARFQDCADAIRC